jgi:hypothetical protein
MFLGLRCLPRCLPMKTCGTSPPAAYRVS